MTNLLHDISWVVELRSDTLTPIFQVFTALGYPNLIMIGLALAYWLWDKPATTRLMTIVVLSTLLNAFLKDYWQNPRPDVMFRLDGEVGASFGMPSGHAQVSAVLWFFLAYELKRFWAWCIAGLVVAGICASRLYLGVHDLEDILAGLLLAFMSLLAYVWVLKSDVLKSLTAQLWMSLAVFILLGVGLRLAWPDPENSVGAIVAVALPVTWLLGIQLSERFGVHTNSVQRATILTANPPTMLTGKLTATFAGKLKAMLKGITMSILGIAVLLGLLSVLKSSTSVLAPEISSLFITAALGLHVTLLAPMLFKLCKLTSS